MKQDKLQILGVYLHVADYDSVLKTIFGWVRQKKNTYVCFVNAYALMNYHQDPLLRKGVNTAGLVLCDGMPLVWLGRLYGKKTTRVYGTTLVRKLCERATDLGLTFYLLGGQRGQSADIVHALTASYPGLKIVGTAEAATRPLEPRVNRNILSDIRKTKPDIVLVGLGCPHQERWILEYRDVIGPTVCIGIGSTFDFISGWKKEAPVWVQTSGMEWLYRFIQEPQRLWYRYTVMNAQFLWLIMLQLVRDMYQSFV